MGPRGGAASSGLSNAERRRTAARSGICHRGLAARPCPGGRARPLEAERRAGGGRRAAGPVAGTLTASKRFGFVALIGAPNAGKSTLLNQLVGTKLAIVSPKVQTTRSRLIGIAVSGMSQIV